MSLPVYPDYQATGIEWLNEIPLHWSVFGLKRSVAGCVNGIWGDEPDGENDIAVIRVADFIRDASTVGLDKLTYRSVPQKDIRSRKLKCGDLLIEKSGGGEKTLVGCVVLFEHSFDAVTSNFVARMRPLPEYDSRFLCYSFDTLYKSRVQFPSVKQTTGIQNLDSEAYLQERFCFPPLGEQIQIVRFLDYETARIDALIEEQQRLIELLKEKRQAVISHAVTKGLNPNVLMKDSGVEWIGEVPGHWDVMQLRRITHLQQGLQMPQQERFFEEGEGRVEYITVKSINAGDKAEHKEYVYLPSTRVICGEDDVLLARTGATGHVVTDVSGAFHNNFFKVNYDKKRITKDYLVFFLTVAEVKSHLLMLAGTTTIPDLNHGAFLGTIVCVPGLAEQKKICEYLEKTQDRFNYLKDQAHTLIDLLQERRAALISAAVTGKIDVRDWQPPADKEQKDKEQEAAHG